MGPSLRSQKNYLDLTEAEPEGEAKRSITSDGGPLGSRVDEGRSKLREVV